MSLETYLRAMPKLELHVHMEGSIRPETLLALAAGNNVPLPATSPEELLEWYKFIDFDHFIDIYLTSARALKTPEDIELLGREFLAGQAAQNILYSEVTYTPYNQFLASGLPWEDQLAALNRARAWGEETLGVRCGLVIDIPRVITPEEGLTIADWAVSGMGRGVVAFGLGGPEVGFPPELFREAFERARRAGLPGVPHAGETEGPASIRGALEALEAVRIGHGVRCLEDPALVAELRRRQIPLEVCPSSNVCLKVVPSLAAHPLPRLMDAGLMVTLNSDDPPLFNTTLTEEYLRCAGTFGFDAAVFEGFVLNALHACFLPDDEKALLEQRLRSDFVRLRKQHLA